MKKIFKVIVILIVAITSLSTTYSTVNAKRHYTTTPKSLRGIWYCYDPLSYGYDKLKITKYTYYYRPAGGFGPTASGKRYLKSVKANQLYVSKKSKNGYYSIGFNGLNHPKRRHYKRTHRGKYIALKNYDGVQSTPIHQYTEVLYWLHVKLY